MKKTTNPLVLNPARTRSVLSLFNKDNCYTDEALRLISLGQERLLPLFIEFRKKGFEIREIIHILHWSVTDLELDAMLDLILPLGSDDKHKPV